MIGWIVFLSLGWIIIRQIYRIIRMQNCPDSSVIAEYFYGRLKKNEPEEYDNLMRHLGICEKCQNELTDLINKDAGTDKSIEDHLIRKS